MDTNNSTIGLFQWNDSLQSFELSNCLNTMLALDSNQNMNINFNPCISLNNNINGLQIPCKLKGRNLKTFLMVYLVEDTINENAVWTYRLNDDKSLGLSTTRLKTLYNEYEYTTTIKSKAYLNTIHFSIKENLLDSASGFTIGRTDSLDFNGHIAEYILISERVKKEDIQKWQSYLAIKYGITIKEQNYISSDDSIIWELGSTYNAAIIGVGMDTVFGLNQKQSCSSSSHDVISFGLGGISTSNIYNQNQPVHGQFIMLAHNNASLSFDIDTLSQYSILHRQWKLKVNGTNSNTLPTTIKLDLKAIDFDTTAFAFLIINRDGTDDFSTSIPEIIMPDSISMDSFAYFNNIHWDTDNSGFDVFSFAVLNLKTRTQEASNGNTPQNGSSIQNDMEFINDPSRIIAYRLYPNPSLEGNFTLEVFSKKKTDFEVTIFDINGKLIKSYFETNQKQLSITDQLFSQGEYLLRVSSEEEVKTFTLIIN